MTSGFASNAEPYQRQLRAKDSCDLAE